MRVIPILKALKNISQMNRFIPYLLDTNLQVEKKIIRTELNSTGYQMEDFAADNQLVTRWFSQ